MNNTFNQEYDYDYDADCDDCDDYQDYDDYDYDYYDHYDDYDKFYDYEFSTYDHRRDRVVFTEGIYFDEEDITSELFNSNCCRNVYLDLANGVFG